MSKIAEVWFAEAKNLSVGEALFLRVANKKEQIKLANSLEKERENFAFFDPMLASQLFIIKTIKNMKQYVVIERKYRSPYTAFLKTTNGKVEKLTIDPERNRQIKLMLKDKKTQEEIEETLNGLTDNELIEFFHRG